MSRHPSGTAKTGAERVAAYRARQREARALADANRDGNGNGAAELADVSCNDNGPTEPTDVEKQLTKVAACLRELEVECQRYRNELVRYRIELARNRNGETVTSAPSGATIRQAREDRDQRIRDLLVAVPRWPTLKIAREVGATTKVIRRVQRELAAASDTGQPQSDRV
jgi:hypothetical protein